MDAGGRQVQVLEVSGSVRATVQIVGRAARTASRGGPPKATGPATPSSPCTNSLLKVMFRAVGAIRALREAVHLQAGASRRPDRETKAEQRALRYIRDFNQGKVPARSTMTMVVDTGHSAPVASTDTLSTALTSPVVEAAARVGDLAGQLGQAVDHLAPDVIGRRSRERLESDVAELNPLELGTAHALAEYRRLANPFAEDAEAATSATEDGAATEASVEVALAATPADVQQVTDRVATGDHRGADRGARPHRPPPLAWSARSP